MTDGRVVSDLWEWFTSSYPYLEFSFLTSRKYTMAERRTSLSTWFKRTPFNGKIIVKGELLETYEAMFGSIDEAISMC